MESTNREKETLFFNGTGVNYSWHFPRMAKLDFNDLEGSYADIYLISGGTTAFCVLLGRHLGLLKWKREDFLNWNALAKKVYGSNLATGFLRLLRLATGVGLPIVSEDLYRKAFAIAAQDAFFELKVGELPPNVCLALQRLEDGKIVEVRSGGAFDELPLYRVSFAATAIPKFFPTIELGGVAYGDAIYAKGFIPWLKKRERAAHYFHNYNLSKSAEYRNGVYHQLMQVKNPKRQLQIDNFKFFFGLPIASYPENVRKAGF